MIADVDDKVPESTALDVFVSELEERNRELKREIAEMEENKKLMEKLVRYNSGESAPVSGCSGGLPRRELSVAKQNGGLQWSGESNGAQEIVSLDAL